ncbi:MAG: ATP-binding protein [Cyanobacteria bacterium J06623_5]
MFDPFFTTKAVGKGTGLGMSISHEIITEKHHGTLTCERLNPHGTRFTITIPTFQNVGG